MTRRLRLLLLLTLGAVLCLALVAGGLQLWLGSSDFRLRAQAMASEAAGVPVQLERLAVTVWPLAGVAAIGIEVQTAAPLRAQRVEARPSLSALLGGRLELASLRVSGAELPQQGIDELMRRMRERSPPPGPAGGPAGEAMRWPAELSLERVRWTRKDAQPIVADLRLSLDASDGALAQADLTLIESPWPDARASLGRRDADTWMLKVALASGTVQGPLQLRRDGGPWQLDGRLDTQGVEVARLGSGRLRGRLEARTTLQARGATPAALLAGLQTQSSFTVREAVLVGLDLARAVKTVGMTRGGETPLDLLAGQLATRGESLALTQLVASSGALSATGHVNVAARSRALSGRVTVKLGSGLVGEVAGVPLVLGGTLDNPELSLTRGAAIGAAVGTLVMPGVGTGAGANLGDRVGDRIKGLFGR